MTFGDLKTHSQYAFYVPLNGIYYIYTYFFLFRATQPLVTVETQENIYGSSPKNLPVKWLEIHPLFDGSEFDLAILTLSSYIQR